MTKDSCGITLHVENAVKVCSKHVHVHEISSIETLGNKRGLSLDLEALMCIL